ncbi:MAG: hypothetical protein JO257_36030 [Deltaproteobacteria bacterium]|nr:hypothetical protein [Deltaproteobacteria bacterium]
MRSCLLVILASCAYKAPKLPDAAVGDAPDAAIDAPPDPCQLPSLTMKVATLSGCAQAGTTDGPRGEARFANPVNVVLSQSGIAYVADFDSDRIRKVDATGKATTLVALPKPFGLAFDSAGFLLVETDDDDLGNHTMDSGTIWRVNPATAVATMIVRDIGRPRGLAVLPDGRVALADYIHDTLAILDVQAATVTPLAGTHDVGGHANGNGSAALFDQPWDIVYVDGALYVTEVTNGDIRKVTLTGDVTDLVAPGSLDQPQGIAADAAHTLYITEWHGRSVKKIVGTQITLIAGGNDGYLDSDTPTAAKFYALEGLDVTPDGHRIVIADGNHGDMSAYNHVRQINN